MSVNFNDFVCLAEELAEKESEIAWRDAASRAYYAAYHRANEVIDLCPDNSHLGMGSHERTSDRFVQHGSKGARSIAYVLVIMKKIRVSADYEIVDQFEHTSAQNQVAQAKVFFEKIAAFENHHRPLQAKL